MTFFKRSFLFSTSLLLGVHSTWAMDDVFLSEKRGSSLYSNRKIDYDVKEKKSNNKSFTVTLSSTQLPLDQKDESIFQDFVYSWKLEAPRPKALSARMCAEETPFIGLKHLMKLPPNIPHNEQSSVHFTKQRRKTILDLYFQGKLDLTWTRGHYNFNQYCTDEKLRFQTLAVTSQEDNVTYYKRQRYSDTSHSKIQNVFCDSWFQLEYWKDEESWVVDHPDEGETKHTTRRMALKTLKSVGELSVEERIIGAEDGVLSFFVHPYRTWMQDKAERKNEESPSYWKAGLLGYLALSGEFLRNTLNVSSFKEQNTHDEKETQSNENKIPSIRTSTNDENFSTSVFSNFSPYSLIAPLLVSSLASKDRKFNYLPFLSIASTLFSSVNADGIVCVDENLCNDKLVCNDKGVCYLIKPQSTKPQNTIQNSVKKHYRALWKWLYRKTHSPAKKSLDKDKGPACSALGLLCMSERRNKELVM